MKVTKKHADYVLKAVAALGGVLMAIGTLLLVTNPVVGGALLVIGLVIWGAGLLGQLFTRYDGIAKVVVFPVKFLKSIGRGVVNFQQRMTMGVGKCGFQFRKKPDRISPTRGRKICRPRERVKGLVHWII
ncbi:hypothetical protein [Desmospora profundinema]|uniref:Uncharacterized protein n=1 Tax=Desmospora profundinema TaxID=1571184 RepID=A0ABU1IQH9_9BACL|nr:hypothetical protein [Desmospora profundinema]MDR6227052.1 hypothetical protein [Desmospora profundinema]